MVTLPTSLENILCKACIWFFLFAYNDITKESQLYTHTHTHGDDTDDGDMDGMHMHAPFESSSNCTCTIVDHPTLTSRHHISTACASSVRAIIFICWAVYMCCLVNVQTCIHRRCVSMWCYVCVCVSASVYDAWLNGTTLGSTAANVVGRRERRHRRHRRRDNKCFRRASS